MAANDVPFAIRACYQTEQWNTGIPVNSGSVFDALYDPPTTGVAAEAAAKARGQANGVNQPNAAALAAASAHRDGLRDFYDSASIVG